MYTSPHPVAYYFYPLLDTTSTPKEIESFKLLLNQEVTKDDDESLLYVHIPFCNDLCKFCPFHVKVKQENDAHEKYVNALVREIKTISQTPYLAEKKYGAIYFGGGSPSVLSTTLVNRLFSAINEYLEITPDCEISFEGEPKGLGQPELLECLAEHKVSRISFGLQTYDQKLRDLFNINATLDDVQHVLENARKLDFKDINADLMYDLPGQTVSSLMYDLEMLAKDQYDSIDYYNLHYYAFPKQMHLDFENGKLPKKPNESMHLALFNEIDHFLLELGYKNVADQVYSKFDEPSVFYKILWGGGSGRHTAETVGVGASSRGYLSGYSYMNLPNTNEYIKHVSENSSLPISRMSSKLNDPINRGLVHFPKFYNIPVLLTKRNVQTFDLFKKWEDHGYVRNNNDTWHLTQQGKYWVNNMMKDLFEPQQLSIADRSLNDLLRPSRSRTGTF